MRTFICKKTGAMPGTATPDRVALPYDQRCRSRLAVTLASGEAAGILLPRAERLFDGDVLESEDGALLRIEAAPERLLEVHCHDGAQFARAAYHLGNRHVPVQVVDAATLRFPVDHVLAHMLEHQGIVAQETVAPFEPESGAYGSSGGGAGGHAHGHDLGHSHDHAHSHAHGHDHAHDPLHDPGHGEHRSPRRIHDFAGS